jgi:hypothetical protein
MAATDVWCAGVGVDAAEKEGIGKTAVVGMPPSVVGNVGSDISGVGVAADDLLVGDGEVAGDDGEVLSGNTSEVGKNRVDDGRFDEDERAFATRVQVTTLSCSVGRSNVPAAASATRGS